MRTAVSPLQKTYTHLVLTGTPYEAGRFQACFHRHNPQVAFFTQPLDFDACEFGFASLEEMQAELDRFCPGLNEEIAGFGDELGLSPAQVFHYSACAVHTRSPACSQFIIHPSITRDGAPLAGRNYDLNANEEDLCLVSQQIEGKYRHVGFSTLFFGRLDGVNEHGFAATMSMANPTGRTERVRGFDFWVYMRAVLDGCHSVSDALDLLREMPLNCCQFFILSDASGDAALVENSCTNRAIQRIDASDIPYLVGNNHYALPEMTVYNGDKDLHWSTCRRAAIIAMIEATRPHITDEDVRSVLSTPYPTGCYFPYQTFGGSSGAGGGTLWSEVIYPADRKIALTFGAPTSNPWLTFGLEDAKPGATQYRGMLPLAVDN